MKRSRGSGPEQLAAVILVGGPTGATQFRPLSLDLPKPLFPLAGKPMIYHHILACAKVDGLNEVFILGDFDVSVFSDFIRDVTKEFNMKVTYLKEEEPLGTAGGLLRFKERILHAHDYIFLLHSDICCSFPLKELLSFHKNQREAYITMMGTKVDASVAPTYGCYVADNTHKMVHYAEHPESFVSDTINAGVYVFSADAFSAPVVKNPPPSNDLMSEPDQKQTGFVSMERDILPNLIGKVYVFDYQDFWKSIKSAGGVVLANKFYIQWYAKVRPETLQLPPNVKCEIEGQVIIDPTAVIDPSAKIGPNVYIGPNSKISRGVRVSNSIILNNAVLKEAACVLYSIIAQDCTVGQWTRVEGIPTSGGTSSEGNDRFRRQGITMFGKGVTANSEIVIRNCIVMPHKGISRSVCNEILL